MEFFPAVFGIVVGYMVKDSIFFRFAYEPQFVSFQPAYANRDRHRETVWPDQEKNPSKYSQFECKLKLWLEP